MSDENFVPLDETEYPNDHLDRIERHVAITRKARAEKAAADQAATLNPEEHEKAEMRKLGEMEGVEGRRLVYKTYGFDPNWR